MTLDQLKKIGQLDQLKKTGVLTPEEYDKARERVLAEVDEEPAKPAHDTKPKNLTSSYYIFGAVLVAALLATLLMSPDKSESSRDSSSDALSGNTESSPVQQSRFNPDIRQTANMLTVVNRDALPYEGCELTVNDRYSTKIPRVKPEDAFIIPYRQLVDDEGNIFKYESMKIVDLEFYCKEFDGHSDILSLERD